MSIDETEFKEELKMLYEFGCSFVKKNNEMTKEILTWLDRVKSDVEENNDQSVVCILPKTPAASRRLRKRSYSSVRQSNSGTAGESSFVSTYKSRRNAAKNARFVIQKQLKLNLRDKMRRPLLVTSDSERLDGLDAVQEPSTSKDSVIISSEQEECFVSNDYCKRISRLSNTAVVEDPSTSKHSGNMPSQTGRPSVRSCKRISRLATTAVTQEPSTSKQTCIIPSITQKFNLESCKNTSSYTGVETNDHLETNIMNCKLHDEITSSSKDFLVGSAENGNGFSIESCDQNSALGDRSTRIKSNNNVDLEQNEKGLATCTVPVIVSAGLVIQTNKGHAVEEVNCQEKVNERKDSESSANVIPQKNKSSELALNGFHLRVKLCRLPQYFRQYETPSVKSCVASYEKLNSGALRTPEPTRMTRTKTRAIATAAFQASRCVPSKLNSPANSAHRTRYGTPLASKVLLDLSNLCLNNPINSKPRDEEIEEHKEEERRKFEHKENMALQRRIELLKCKTDKKRRKREEKMKKVMLTRQANEKEREDQNKRLYRERKDKLKQVAEEREAKLKEEAQKLKQQTLKKALRAEEKRKMNALQLTKEEEERNIGKQKEGKARKKMKQVNAATDYNDYGVDDVNSGDSSDDEDNPKKKIPLWGHRYVRSDSTHMQAYIQKKLKNLFFKCENHTPDLALLFKGIDKRLLIRTSSANWKTPPRFSTLPKY